VAADLGAQMKPGLQNSTATVLGSFASRPGGSGCQPGPGRTPGKRVQRVPGRLGSGTALNRASRAESPSAEGHHQRLLERERLGRRHSQAGFRGLVVLEEVSCRDLMACVRGAYHGDCAEFQESANAAADPLHGTLAQVAEATEQGSSAAARLPRIPPARRGSGLHPPLHLTPGERALARFASGRTSEAFRILLRWLRASHGTVARTRPKGRSRSWRGDRAAVTRSPRPSACPATGDSWDASGGRVSVSMRARSDHR